MVVPAYNAAKFIRDQLDALARQDFAGTWEVIVADNGSRDGTREVVDECRQRMSNLRLVDASDRRGVASARNRGAATAKGRYLAFCDADDIVTPQWLSSFLREAPKHHVWYGALRFFDDQVPDARALHEVGDLEVGHLLTDPFGYLPFASGGNMLVAREAFLELRGFDEHYAAGEDVDFCWRAQYSGYSLGTSEALIYIRVRRSGLARFKQYFGYGKGEAHLYRHHHERGMARSRFTRSIAVYGWLIVIGIVALVRRDPFYRYWVHAAGRRMGRIAGSWQFRCVYL